MDYGGRDGRPSLSVFGFVDTIPTFQGAAVAAGLLRKRTPRRAYLLTVQPHPGRPINEPEFRNRQERGVD